MFPASDRMFHLPGRFAWIQCNKCGLARLSPRPKKESLGFYYPENEYYSYEPPLQFHDPETIPIKEKVRNAVLSTKGYPADGGPARIFSPLLAKLFFKKATYNFGEKFPDFTPGGRALDIGSGSGRFLGLLKRHGWEVQGIDLSERASRAAKEKLDIDVFVGDLSGTHFEEHSFDFISLNHSLEHIPDLNETLTEVRRILKPTGILYIEVPNIESLGQKWSKEFWSHWDQPRHLYGFSPATLRQLLEKHGFAIQSQKTIRSDSYKKDQIFRREELSGNHSKDRETLLPAEILKAKMQKFITDLYFFVDRRSGDYLCCWACMGKASDMDDILQESA